MAAEAHVDVSGGAVAGMHPGSLRLTGRLLMTIGWVILEPSPGHAASPAAALWTPNGGGVGLSVAEEAAMFVVWVTGFGSRGSRTTASRLCAEVAGLLPWVSRGCCQRCWAPVLGQCQPQTRDWTGAVAGSSHPRSAPATGSILLLRHVWGRTARASSRSEVLPWHPPLLCGCGVFWRWIQLPYTTCVW